MSQLKSSADLSAYRVRESQRAKRVSIKVSVEGDVEVVIPRGFDRAKLPEMLAQRQAWIEKTQARLQRDRRQTADDWQIEKPDKILFRWRSNDIDADIESLKAAKTKSLQAKKKIKASAKGFARRSDDKKGILETWSIAYEPSSSGAGLRCKTLSRKTLCIPDSERHCLTLQGNTEHLPDVQAVLRKWLAHRAKRDLGPWLKQLGFHLNLPCRHISVRGQKTCWASCSTRKDISLNFKLLFLPRPLVHYVLVHELCHTVHMNHSKAFWALVEEKQPDYQWRKEAIKTAWRYVPRWVEGK